MSVHRNLTILQYNTMKSRNKVMAALLRDPATWEYDILAIQEPWHNPYSFSTHNPCKDHFHLAFPAATEEGPARVCFFVNTCLDRAHWTVREHSRDLMTLKLQYIEHGQSRCIHIHNLYREATRGNITAILDQLNGVLDEEEQHLVVGDFNLHHPTWGGIGVEGDPQAEQLLQLMDERQLSLLLPQGSITWQAQHFQSTIDLALGSPAVTQRLVGCGTLDRHHDSDHYPIATTLMLTATEATPRSYRQWEKTDAKALQQALQEQLPLPLEICGDLATEQHIEDITRAVQAAIQVAVPMSTPSKWSKPGFSPEAKEVIRDVNRARRRWQREQTTYTWDVYCKARNKKGKKLAKLMRVSHQQRVEAASKDPKGLWKLAKWAKNRGTTCQAFTPALKRTDGSTVTEPEGKAGLLRATFFPTPPEADLSDIDGYRYPEPVSMPPITEAELRDAILRAPGNKAPGPDNIPNRILHMALPQLLPLLLPLYNICLNSGRHLTAFKHSTTVVLRKPNKGDYQQAKAYRPVALLNTMGKAMESVLARRISYLTEVHNLLPKTLLGGRKMVSTEHAIHALLEQIHGSWESATPVTSLLMLDVSGAFDNVSHKRLLHNLRKRRLPVELVNWIGSFLQGRTSTLKLPEFESEPFNIHTGIPQGSPLSPILYLFYNADMLDLGNDRELRATATSWIDDIGIMVTGKTAEENCQALQTVHARAELWARRHASVFAPAKYELIHFTNRPKKHSTSAELVLDTHTVQASATCRVLGVILDSHLEWEAHLRHIQARTTTSLGGLAAIAGSTWGFGLKDLRRLYVAVVLPQILYCCSAWYSPDSGHGTVMRQKRSLQKLTAIQCRAGAIIAGAFRTTAGSALDVELFLLPMKQQLEKAIGESLLRVITAPTYTLIQAIRPAFSRTLKWRSPLERLELRYTTQLRYPPGVTTFEPKAPYVVPPWWEGPTIHIDSNEDDAIRRHDVNTLCQDRGVLDIYTDGSGIEGSVGAAAVAPAKGTGRMTYMGTEDTSTVYAAELQGIAMATGMARGAKETTDPDLWAVNIYTDNQAAIRSAAKPGAQSGQYLLQRIAKGVDSLHRLKVQVRIHWIPAHVGVPGNEAADKAAKAAALGPRREGSEEFWPLTAPGKTRIRRRIAKEWANEWENGTSGRVTFSLEQKPNRQVLDKHTGLRRYMSSLITQLRTGKIGLAHYLHAIGRADSPRCPCDQGIQTVRHVLTECQRTRDLREELLGRANNVKRILKDSALAKAAALLMIRGNLLGQFRAVEETPEDLEGLG